MTAKKTKTAHAGRTGPGRLLVACSRFNQVPPIGRLRSSCVVNFDYYTGVFFYNR